MFTFFREDIGVNAHHWHWHLVYSLSGPVSVLNKDRRGELFYYMHQQMLARYNCTRLAHNCRTVQPLSNLREPLKNGYYPNLTTLTSSRTIPPRQYATQLKDLTRNPSLKVGNLELWRNRLTEAIDLGYAVDVRINHHSIHLSN